MNEKYTAQAASQEEAIAKGLNALGITREEAIITVEETGKKGFLGFGQKDAIVVIEKKKKIDLVDEFLSNELDLDEHQKNSVETEEIVEEKEQRTEIKNKEKAEIQENKETSKKKTVANPEIVKKKDEVDLKEQETEKLNDEEAIEAVRNYFSSMLSAD